MIPVAFGDYSFNRAHVVQFTDNFDKLATAITPVIGASGGVNQYGLDSAPAGKGSVNLEFWIHAASQQDMATALTRLGALLSVGRAQLWRETWDGQRQFCWAYLASAPRPQAYRAKPDQRLQVKLTFDVPDPRWFGYGTNTALWDSVTWGAFTWGGTPTVVSVGSATSASATLTNNGNVPVELVTVLSSRPTGAIVYPIIRRVVGGQVVQEVRYNEYLTNNRELLIDPRAHKVLLNGLNARENFEYETADWLTLEPGANTISILFEQNSVCTVAFHFFEAYR